MTNNPFARRPCLGAVLCCAGLALALGACGRPAEAPFAQGAAPPVHPHAAHQLLVDTASCWFGGMWGDVQGETPQERIVSSQRRCEDVVRRVFGSADHARYLQLRAFEPTVLAEVKSQVAALAAADPIDAPHAEIMGKMFTALADAQYETMLQRRATTRILRDFERGPGPLSDAETSALRQLEVSKGFDELFFLDAGPLQREASTLVLLVAMDRMRVAEDLPVHLKPYPVTHVLKAIFGVPEPALPHDASKPLPRAGWLTYLTNAAAIAGHPVEETTAHPRVRHEAAIAGISEGIADRLRANLEGIGPDTPLGKVTSLTIRALEGNRERVGP